MQSVKFRAFRVFLIPLVIGLGLVWLFVRGVQAGSLAQIGGSLFTGEDKPEGRMSMESVGETGIVLELQTFGFDIEESTADGQPCQVLSVSGYAQSGESGHPRLPVRGALVGIPPGASPKLTVLDAEVVQLPQAFDICPAMQPQVEMEFSGEVNYLGQEAHKDTLVYNQDSFMPAEIVELSPPGYLRSQRVARVLFQPFQYNPESGELLQHRRVGALAEIVDFGPVEQTAEEGVSVILFSTLASTILL